MFCTAILTLLAIEPQPDGQPKPLRWGVTPPALQVSQWITKRPPAMPGPQTDGAEHLFVVHFWSMRDEHSRGWMPHLAQLHKEFAAQRVAIIAISNEDPDDLTNYMSQWKEPLPYAVAADDENHSSETWLAEVAAFPWTFVLDRAGKVIWSGDSMWQLRDILADAVEGKYTLTTARKRVDAVKKIEQLNSAMKDAMENGDIEAVQRIADRIIAADPARIEGYTMKRALLRRLARRERGDESSLREMSKMFEAMRAASWDSSAGLAELIEWQASEPDVRLRDPALVLRCVRRLAELTRGKDPFALEKLARAQYELGWHAEAIASQRAAARLIAWDPDGQFEATLAYYERVQRTASQASSRPAASSRAAE